MMTTGLTVAGAAAPAQAQEATRTFNIPAQPLANALTAFGQQSGLQVSVPAPLVEGRTSSAVAGDLPPVKALSQMLVGTGLTFRVAGTTVALEPAPQASAGAISLGPVRVEGEGRGTGTADPAYALQRDGKAAQGYRSDNVSAIGPWQGRRLQDTPYSITVLSSDLIENLQATSPDQLYRISPNMQLSRAQYENDQPVVYMRGFGVGGQYRDGLPGDQYGHGITTEDVQSVEVFSGLSGFLYGPGNVGGMINYVSKRPTADRFNQVTLGDSGGGNYYVHGDFGGPIDSAGRFGYRINGVWQDGNTAIDRQVIKKGFVSGAFDWRVTDKLLWQVDAAYRDYEVFGGQANWGLDPGVARPSAEEIDTSKSWGQPWEHRWYVTQRYASRLRWDVNDAVDVRLAGLYNNSKRNFGGSYDILHADGTYTQTISDLFAPGDNSLLSEQYDWRGYAYADFRFNTGPVGHTLTAGVQYQHSWQQRYTNEYPPDFTYTGLTLDHPTYFPKPVQVSIGDRGPRGTVSDYDYTSWMAGDDIRFNDQWSLLLGVASVTVESKPITFFWPADGYNKSAVTPNLSLIFKPIEGVTTYATYLQSLEQGGVAGDDYDGRPVVNAGQVLNPDISQQIEVGAKWSVGGLLLTTALFQIDKALEYYDLSNLSAIRYVQDGREVHRGVEFTAFGKLTNDLTLTGGLTFLDAKVTKQKESPGLEGKQPPGVAESIVKLRAEYRLPALPALSLSAAASYTGSQYVDAMNTDRLPGYTLVDLGARYQMTVANHPLTLRLDVYNVTGKAYWSQDGSLGDPRTVLFSVSSQF